MMEERYSIENPNSRKEPTARYAYYRRCQMFRKGGEQCKAPAEKGSQICHAHAGQMAMALRRERERRAVLDEAVAQMRQCRPEFEAKDLFMSFDGIQVTLAVVAQTVIDGGIDCKAAGRLLAQLQAVSKLLWMIRKSKSTTEAWGHGEKPGLPQICADERRLSKATELPELFVMPRTGGTNTGQVWASGQREETRIALAGDICSTTSRTGVAHGPPQWARAA